MPDLDQESLHKEIRSNSKGQSIWQIPPTFDLEQLMKLELWLSFISLTSYNNEL